MNSDILDNLDESAAQKSPLHDALVWWEGKRLWFNILVAAAGLLVVMAHINRIDFSEVVGLIFYALLMNIFYSVGFLLEALNIYYLKRNTLIEKLRWPLFILGTVACSGLTYIWASVYFWW